MLIIMINKIIYKIGILSIALAIIINTLGIPFAVAQIQGIAAPDVRITTVDQVFGILNRGLNYLFMLFFVGAVFYLLLGAVDYLSQKPDDGKKKIKNAIIAMVIVIIARGIPALIQAILGTLVTA